MQPEYRYGWCKHRTDQSQPCYICEKKNIKFQEKIRKKHGKKCNCYTCDWDDYWRYLGKQ